MPFVKKLKSAAFLGLVAVALPGLGMADTTWTWKFGSNDGGCEAGNCNGQSHTMTFNPSGPATNPDVVASGWSNTADNDTRLGAVEIERHTGGLGVENSSRDQHGVDNLGRYDLVLFDFGSVSVALHEVSLGWYSNDTDLSILAYTGSGSPNLDGVVYNSDDEQLTGSGGWQHIGNYDVDAGDPSQYGPWDVSFNTDGSVQSSYWIVAAYNNEFGSDCKPYGKCKEGNDYFKIRSITGKHREPNGEVPVPGTLLLSALGIAMLVRQKKRA